MLFSVVHKQWGMRETRPPADESDVVVELDGRRRDRARCTVDPSPDGTALVEIGNGTVSVTQGLYP